jgi:outer membrane biosynthesis protein TonB
MDRADRAGLSVALVGHVLLFGALSVSLLRPTPKLPTLNPPINVSFIDAKSLQTAAPDAVKEASAPPAAADAPAAPMAPPEPVAAPPLPKIAPAPPLPKPVAKAPAKVAERPTPKPVPKAAAPAKKEAATTAPPRTSRLGGMGAALSQAATRENERPGTGRGTAEKGSGTPAAKTAAQLEASYVQALLAKVKKYWRAPTGLDAELLRSDLVVTLNRDGSVGNINVKSQSGDNENNMLQKGIHAERAKYAVRRAAPFELPAEDYAIWQSLELKFDKRLN